MIPKIDETEAMTAAVGELNVDEEAAMVDSVWARYATR